MQAKAKTAENTIELKKIKETVKKDAIERIEVERKFGLAKRRYSMGLVMEKLPLTALAAVSLTILVMNLDKILRWIFLSLFSLLSFTRMLMTFILESMERLYFCKNAYSRLKPVVAFTG
jgi:hypothetical protein